MTHDRRSPFALVLDAHRPELAEAGDMRLAIDLAFLSLVVSCPEDLDLLLGLAERAPEVGPTYPEAVHALADVIRQQGVVALGSLLNIARSTL